MGIEALQNIDNSDKEPAASVEMWTSFFHEVPQDVIDSYMADQRTVFERIFAGKGDDEIHDFIDHHGYSFRILGTMANLGAHYEKEIMESFLQRPQDSLFDRKRRWKEFIKAIEEYEKIVETDSSLYDRAKRLDVNYRETTGTLH